MRDHDNIINDNKIIYNLIYWQLNQHCTVFDVLSFLFLLPLSQKSLNMHDIICWIRTGKIWGMSN